MENKERTRNFHHDLRELNHKSRWNAKQGCDILVAKSQKSEHKKLTIKNTIVHYSLFLWTFRSRERICMKSLKHFRARAKPLKGSFFKQKGGYCYTIDHRGNWNWIWKGEERWTVLWKPPLLPLWCCLWHWAARLCASQDNAPRQVRTPNPVCLWILNERGIP